MSILAEISAFVALAVSLLNAVYTLLQYRRESIRQDHEDMPIIEASAHLNDKKNFAEVPIVIRNTRSSTILIESITITGWKNISLHGYFGDPVQFDDIELMDIESNSDTTRYKLDPIDDSHFNSHSIAIGYYNYFIPSKNIEDKSLNIEIIFSWQNPEFRRVRVRRTVRLSKSDIERLHYSV
ncbi:hypothetical protein [Thalassobaculum litoreum]|uniref:hypothetical protein n=1 Tax=Thalassobaculum litoreum TaxID=420996 RepID=UPI001113C2D4|nr:hypothetical protein [Thalassobaculum litoreum]